VRARELKDAGLTGVCVSLDHHEEMMHNYFRHHAQAYTMAKEAVAACREAGLVTGLSLCATKEFVSEENLNAYLELAKEWGVAFIQILEPRAVGHYQGKDVNLSADQKRMLENTFIKVNTNFSFRAYPIIIYHEFYQATLGCRGGGKGSFYIDPQGEVHPCPFCRRSEGNLLYDSVEKCVDNLLKSGCPMVIPEAEKIDKSGKDELEVVLTN
jgi:MoaA/NifB/PqqE/SkfB family radical SAM enzyme